MNKSLLIGIALSSLILACSTEASYRVSSQLTSPYVTATENRLQDDETLEDRLNDQLAEELPKSAILVVVDHSNVLLVGQVLSATDKAKAEDLCQQLPNVKQVFNHLTTNIKPKLNTNSSMRKEFRERLSHQNDLDFARIRVVAIDNVIYIMGSNVGNLKALDYLVNWAYSIEGVKNVQDLEQQGPEDYYSK